MRVPSFAGEAPGSYPGERGSIPRGLTTRQRTKGGSRGNEDEVFQLWRAVSSRDRPLSPSRRTGVRTVHEAVRLLAEGTHETSLGWARLLRPRGNEHPAGNGRFDLKEISARRLDGKPPVSGTGGCGFDPRGADRSFVQWEGRGPTNRRRGFDSLSSDNASGIPRSKVVSRPLKPVTLVRFQLGEPDVWWPWCTGVHASL